MDADGSLMLYQSIGRGGRWKYPFRRTPGKPPVCSWPCKNKTLFWWNQVWIWISTQNYFTVFFCFFFIIFFFLLSEAGKERRFRVEERWMEQSTERSLMNVNILEWPSLKPDLNPFKHLSGELPDRAGADLETIKIKKALQIFCLCCTFPQSLCFMVLYFFIKGDHFFPLLVINYLPNLP